MALSEQTLRVNIEGIEYNWPRATISPAEIRNLAGLGSDLPLVYEDSEGSERTLKEGEEAQIQPGHRFGRAAKYKRGGAESCEKYS